MEDLLKDTPPEHSILFLMAEVARLMRRGFIERSSSSCLSPAQWRALAFLARNEGINQASLAEILEIKPISLVRMLDRLQEAGLVERRSNPDDRRAHLLFLTDQAAPLIEQMRDRSQEVRQEALQGISAEDRATFLRCLQKMKENLSKCSGSAIGGAGRCE